DDAIGVGAGAYHSCAVRRGGHVVCWGAGGFGQLGNVNFADSTVPTAVFGVTDAVTVVAGANHSCALRATGQVVCWGLGGALGNGSAANTAVPVPVSGLTD